MNRIGKELLEVLKTIEGNGSFAISSVNELVVPGLQIKGFGEVGLPLNPKQVKDIIKVAQLDCERPPNEQTTKTTAQPNSLGDQGKIEW